MLFFSRAADNRGLRAFRSSISNRSVLARRCSRETGILVGWMTHASIRRARNHRANQKAVAAGFEGSNDALDLAAGFDGFVAPAVQRLEQGGRISSDLSVDREITGNDPTDQPVVQAEFDCAPAISTCYYDPRRRGMAEVIFRFQAFGQLHCLADSNDGATSSRCRRCPMADSQDAKRELRPRDNVGTILRWSEPAARSHQFRS